MGMGSTINRPPAGGKGAMGVRPPMNVRPPVIQPGPGVGPRPPVGGKGAGAVRPPAGGKGAMGPVQLELIQKQLAGMPTQGGSYPFNPAPSIASPIGAAYQQQLMQYPQNQPLQYAQPLQSQLQPIGAAGLGALSNFIGPR